MSDADRDEDVFATGPAPPLTTRQRRFRAAVGAGAIVALVAGLALTTARETVPAGVTGTTAGMDMGPGMKHVGLVARDIEGRQFALPSDRMGAVLFMSTEGCGGCVGIARALDEAVARARADLDLTIVSVDTEETAASFARFDAAAGGTDARYALDDASGSIAGQFGVRELGTIVVYDREGMVLETLAPGPGQAAALRRSIAGR